MGRKSFFEIEGGWRKICLLITCWKKGGNFLVAEQVGMNLLLAISCREFREKGCVR
jgi:hypothetical protein